VEIFDILGAAFPSPVAIEVKCCPAKWTHVPVGPAKFDMNRCNESSLRGEKPDFWPMSKFNPGSLPLCGILPVKNTYKHHVLHLQPARVVRSSPNFARWYISSCPSKKMLSIFRCNA